MARIWEMHGSRDFDLGGRTISLTRKWVCAECADETVALNLVLLASPIFFDGLVRESAPARNQGGGVWFVDVRYANIDPQHALPNDAGAGGGGTQAGASGPTDAEELNDAWTFDTTGQTLHITQSLQTRFRTGASSGDVIDEAAASNQNWVLDNERAIGVSGDRVEGTDIYVPRLEFTRDVMRSHVKMPYLRTLYDLTGKCNDAQFYGFAFREVLYLGASGRYAGGRWSVTHRFAVERTAQNLQVGSLQAIPVKRGWDYIWTDYRIVEADGGRTLQVPKYAYVERVYESADFKLLEIGE